MTKLIVGTKFNTFWRKILGKGSLVAQQECVGICEKNEGKYKLHTNKYRSPFLEEWGYDTVIDMLMYLGWNTCSDIAHAVHQVALFTHCACHLHAAGIQCIVHFLKKT
jgi:hypothetical protein